MEPFDSSDIGLVWQAAAAGARRASRKHQVVQDAADEVLYRFLVRWWQGCPPAKPVGWARRCGLHCARLLDSKQRRLRRLEEVAVPSEDGLFVDCPAEASNSSTRESRRNELMRALTGSRSPLTKRQQEAIKLLMSGLSHNSCARRMSISTSDLRDMLERAKGRLRRFFKE